VISYSHLDSGRQDERVPKSFRDQGPAAAGPDASASEAEALRRALGEAKDEAERARLKEQLRRVANRDFVEAKQPTQADLRSDREKWRVRVYAEGEDSDPDVEFEEQRHQAHEAVREDLVKKDEAELHYPRSCYVCKRRFTRLHQFYDQLCPDCAALNWEKRNQVADLRGRVVLLTGCRVKIGFECGLKLLRCGATVIATTRFPHDCARRYAEQPDFAEWSSRLHIYGLDLRDLRGVVRFCDLLYDKYDRLDAIVNNAAQTVRRPRAYYRHLLPEEAKPADSLPQQLRPLLKGDPHVGPGGPDYTRFMRAYVASEAAPQIAHDGEGKEEADAAAAAATAAAVATAGEGVGAAGEESRGDAMLRVVESAIAQAASGHTSALLSQVAVAPEDHHMHDHRLFPEGARDVTGQQLDLRRVNSWLLLLDQVDPSELVEVFAINCLAPFILNSRLKALMMRVPDADKYIINVSAMEGKFYRHKGPQHPHTNMAKAALNMMTRTSAQDYAKARIYMNSVDTGWINDEVRA
jgi:NAD(P)-dependent dehydrogenase (short-subunit alcohol dehydrogenase family)